MSTDQRLAVLERQMLSLRREVREMTELVDVIASPPWKRFWFFLQGYKLWSLGRWW